MKKVPTWLLEFKSSTYSQTGEDGIIEKILDVLPENDKWCVEFGAGDGIVLSNTRNLIVNKDYSAVLIEADKTKFKSLRNNYLQNPRVIITVNRFVGFNEDDNLDEILKDTPIPVNFDFLSIDIDGNDYHVRKAIKKYKPKVICIEFNYTIPTEIRFVQPPDPSVKQGASLLSLVELGKEKGYELVSVLPFNAFFVKSEYYPLFEIEDNRPEILRTNLDAITYLFISYDGKVIQPLPKFLRKPLYNYNKVEKMVLAIYLLLSNPRIFIKEVFRYLRRRFKPEGGNLLKGESHEAND